MKTKLMDAKLIVALIVFISLPPSAFAVEGGLGRPISGMSIAPYAGVIPPEPGFAFATGETYYEGSDSKTASASALSRAGFSRSPTMKALRRTRSTVLSGVLLALARLLLTQPSWVGVTWILVRAGSTILMSASASRVTLLTLAPA